MKAEHKVVAIALALCALVWIVDAFLAYMTTSNVPYLHLLVLDVPQRAAITRSMMTAVFLAFAFAFSYHVRIRREMLEKAERARAELEKVFQTASDAIRVVDRNHTVIRVNRAFSALVGTSTEELVGMKCHEIFGCEPCDEAICHLERVMDGEIIEDHRGTRKAGDREVVCLLSAAPFRRRDGRVVGMVESFRDISELTEMHERVRQSEERYRALADGSPDPIFVLESNTRILYANPVATQVNGINSAGELVGKRLSDFVIQQDRQRLLQAIYDTITGEAESFEEIVRIDSGGELRSYRLGGSTIRYDHTPATLVFAHEITDLLRAERRIRQERDRAQSYLDIAGTIILVLSPSGEVELINREGREILGLPEEQIVGTNWLDRFVPPDVRDTAIEDFRRAIEDGEGPSNSVGAVITARGERRIIAWDGNPLYNESGNIVGLIASGRDITRRRRAMDELAAEKERLRVTVWSIGDAVIATDTEGHVQLMNQVAEKLTGWDEEEAVRLPVDGVLELRSECTDELIANPVPDVLATGASTESIQPCLVISRDGQERLIDYSAAPIAAPHGSEVLGAVLVLRDVTQREKFDREMERATRLESVGALAGGIAHDFNNHLTAIVGNINLAQLRAEMGEDIADRLQAAEDAAMRARDLTQQLLTFASGGAPITTAVSLQKLLQDAADLALSGSNARCDIRIIGDPAPVDVDEGQARQVLNSLLLNAEQAMPEGGVITVTAEEKLVDPDDVSPLEPGRYVRITVTDEGPGIPPEDTERIFHPFYTTREGASGLGLSVGFSIAQQHGGHLEVDPGAEEGATFCLYFPASMHRSEDSDDDPDDLPTGEGRILIMDDQEAVLASTGDLLENLGYEPEFATDGDEAVEKYHRAMKEDRPYDVALIDLTIPGGMGGRETIEKLREIDPGVRAVVSSGYSNDPIMADYEEYGFCEVLVKPYQACQLATTLHDVLNDNGGSDEDVGPGASPGPIDASAG